MYYLVTDETNVEPSEDSTFFIYGGLVLSSEQMATIHSAICAIRQKYKFEPTDPLKFSTNCRPWHIDRDTYTAAKNEVIESCLHAGVKFIAYLISHKILKVENKATYALNSVLVAFDKKFLTEKDDNGLVMIDRTPDQAATFAQLKNNFQNGLTIENTGAKVELDRVLMYSATCDGASHISSAVDVVLGGFRWVVNTQDKPQFGSTQRKIFSNIAKMMYAKNEGDILRVRDYGLILRPVNIKTSKHQEQYDNLVHYLTQLTKE